MTRTPRATSRSSPRALLAATLLALPASAQMMDMRECDLTTTGAIALPDAGGLYYRRVGLVQEYAPAPGGPEWRLAGLYGQGRTTRPDSHEAQGLALAAAVTPVNGKVVMLSIGMSNTYQEFGRFRVRTLTDAAVHPDLVVVNAAQGSRPADHWVDPQSDVWQNVHDQLSSAGLSSDQVQVAWMKHAVRSPFFPPLTFPEQPDQLEDILVEVIRSLKIHFPNVKLMYLSSRTRAYNTNQAAQSPEPAAYEGGFAVQAVIERQLGGDPLLRFDGTMPPAPWLSWGPYLWIDGTGAPEGQPPAHFLARSDGAIWECSDVSDDGVHPSPPTSGPGDAEGEFKVGDQLMAFFLTDRTTTPWFLRTTAGGPTITSLTANGVDVSGGGTITGAAPFTVSLASVTSANTAGVAWTYDDGTFSYNDLGNSAGQPYFEDSDAPTKVFHVPGTYDVRFAARTGGSGATTLAEFQVVVIGGTPAGCTALIDFDDGVAGQAIEDFYASHGVLFANAQWADALAPPFDGTDDHHGGSLPFGVLPEVSGFPQLDRIDEANAIVVRFAPQVDSVTVRALDVGDAGVAVKAYRRVFGGAPIASDAHFGTGEGTDNAVDLTVSALGIRRIELFQPNAGTSDGTLFDCLSYQRRPTDDPQVGAPPGVVTLPLGKGGEAPARDETPSRRP